MDWTALQTRTNNAALAAFGEDITLAGVAGVRGDFCEPVDQFELGGVSAVAGVPQVIVASAVVPASPVGKTVVARSRNFTVAEVRPDGRGFTTLLLEAVL